MGNSPSNYTPTPNYAKYFDNYYFIKYNYYKSNGYSNDEMEILYTYLHQTKQLYDEKHKEVVDYNNIIRKPSMPEEYRQFRITDYIDSMLLDNYVKRYTIFANTLDKTDFSKIIHKSKNDEITNTDEEEYIQNSVAQQPSLFQNNITSNISEKEEEVFAEAFNNNS
jgi:hypothetical protein